MDRQNLRNAMRDGLLIMLLNNPGLDPARRKREAPLQ